MKIKICYRLFISVLFFFTGDIIASAQASTGFGNPYYASAIDLYEKGQYTDAQTQFQKAAQATSDEILKIDIASHLTLCAIKLQLDNTEDMVVQLDKTMSNNPNADYIHFSLAKQLCGAGQYSKAIKWFEKVDDRELKAEERAECIYLLAYSYFKTNNFEKALSLFSHVRRLPFNDYSTSATYYYAHIEYLRKNYLSANNAFQEIASDSRFASHIALYTLQIHAYQQDYDKLIALGIPLLKTIDDARYPELAYLIANAYFKTQQYGESLHYLNLYRKKTPQITRDDYYLEASLYYRLKKYPEALQALNAVLTIRTDSLAQNALYYAGDIALKNGDSEKAMEYFNAAGKMDFDYTIKDITSFNAAKLSMELYHNTDLLYDYHKANPQKDISRLLAIAYTIDKRYDKAIETILAMRRHIDTDYADIQRIAFMQAMEFYNAASYDNAIKSFDYSLTYSKYDSYIAATARYWKAEALYKKRDYEKAKKQYEDFIHAEGAFNNKAEFQLAHYDIGYCDLKMKQYNDAISWFRKYVNLAKDDAKYLGDAYNCIGDCYFIQQKYVAAAENYDKTIQLKANHVDYAMYQKAISMGLTDKIQQKIEILRTLSTKFPQAEYTPPGIYELGRTYFRLNKFDLAGDAFLKITQRYPNSPYCQPAYIELGLIHVNTGKYAESIDYYKRAVLLNPGSQEAKNALSGLKNAYYEINDVDGYYNFVDQLTIHEDGAAEREIEKQNSRYAQVEKIYLSGECDEAVKSLRHFLQTYPTSTYVTQVNFYLGDCLLRQRQYSEAKTHFGYVINQPQNTFTEPALLGCARSAYKIEDYNEVIKLYEKLLASPNGESYGLEATSRITEACFSLKNYKKAIEAAQEVLRFSAAGDKDQLKALLIRARSMQLTEQTEDALIFYKQLSDKFIKTPEGAEATYRFIDMLYQSGRIDEAINAVFAFAAAQSRQPYWLAQSYIILGDIYVTQNKIEQAKATYKSILDEYSIEGDGIIDVVKTRLAAIQ
jgi:tetratricopeptide (TPR) repeat protein